MTKTTLILIFALVGAKMASAAEPSVTASPLPPAVAKACTQATGENKNVLLEFFSYNSVESKMLRDRILADARVASALKERAILVPVEFEKEKGLCQRYGVTRVPALVLIQVDGTELDHLVGTRPIVDSQVLAVVRLLKGGAGDKTELAQVQASASNPNASLDARLSLADAYVRSANLDQALRELKECLVRSMIAGPDRRYLKTVLARLVSLSASSPSAVDVIRERRDALEKQSDLKTETLQMLFAFNEALKEPGRSVDFYLKVDAKDHLREHFFPVVFVQLVESKHYIEATEMVDLETYVANVYPRQNFRSHDQAQQGQIDNDKPRVIDAATAAVEALLATDHLEKAKRVAGRLIETYDTPATRQKLAAAVQRSAAKNAGEFKKWFDTTYPTKTSSPQVKAGP